jgi:hypothetical protein
MSQYRRHGINIEEFPNADAMLPEGDCGGNTCYGTKGSRDDVCTKP